MLLVRFRQGGGSFEGVGAGVNVAILIFFFFFLTPLKFRSLDNQGEWDGADDREKSRAEGSYYSY